MSIDDTVITKFVIDIGNKELFGTLDRACSFSHYFRDTPPKGCYALKINEKHDRDGKPYFFSVKYEEQHVFQATAEHSEVKKRDGIIMEYDNSAWIIQTYIPGKWEKLLKDYCEHSRMKMLEREQSEREKEKFEEQKRIESFKRRFPSLEL